jgi:prolyl oligopeptidase
VGFWHSSARNDLFVLDRRAPDRGFAAIADGIDARFVPDAQPDALWILSNLDAPRSRVFRVDYGRPERERWREVIPEGPDPINSFGLAGGHIACTLLRGAASAMRLHRLDGTVLREVPMPVPSSIDHWAAEADQDDLFFACQSFAKPPAVYRHRVSTGEQDEWARIGAPVDAAGFETRQEWFTSRDGTRVPMFVVHGAGLSRDGARPTLLYGYGGFDISMAPVFLRGVHVLLERGGVFAMANLRGGGEFGEAWHRAGMLERKQNVFDDCIAAAEWLVAQGYTRPDKLAVHGRSNGGLLVGAMITQRPDLFRAAVCEVPLIDMLRYHRFDFARAWATEYGSSDDPAQFPYLLAYSPYHRVEDGRRYPALLVTAGEKDARCDPLHAKKLAAAVQAATTSEAPVLLRVETAVGHGMGKPVSVLTEEVTDVWCFLARELGLGSGAAIRP